MTGSSENNREYPFLVEVKVIPSPIQTIRDLDLREPADEIELWGNWEWVD